MKHPTRYKYSQVFHPLRPQDARDGLFIHIRPIQPDDEQRYLISSTRIQTRRFICATE